MKRMLLTLAACFGIWVPPAVIVTASIAAVTVTVVLADPLPLPVQASNPFDCHAFRAYDGAGRYQGTTLCYALGSQRQQRAVLTCVISADGSRVYLYGEFRGNAIISRTLWHSGICAVSWQVV